MESILLKFDQNNNFATDITLVKEFLQLIIHSNEKYFSSNDFLHHHSLIILRNWYINLLKQWYDEQIFDETMIYVFETISNLFLKISSYLTDENIHMFKEFICMKSIIEQINLIFEQISINGKYLHDLHIRSLDNLIRTIQRLERNSSEKTNHSFLLDNIIKCICSKIFFDLFLQSITTTQDIEHPSYKFLLHTCTDYIYSHPTNQIHKQGLLNIRQYLLHRFVQWFSEQSSSYRSWNYRLSITLRQICFILTLSIQHHRLIQLDREIFNDYCQLIDSFVNILYSILQSEQSTNQKLIQSLLSTITPNLYTMISSNQLEKYLKTKHITSLILKLIDVDNEEIQLNGFRIFSAILTEQDTKILSNSTNIAHLFIKFLTKMIDDDNQILRFYSILHCLKDVIHYDQIKEELTKQNGIPLLFRCATENKFKPLQVQQPALEILLALTFNQDAYRIIKEYLNRFQLLLTSPHPSISQIVNCLLWRYEKIDELKPTSNNYQYDIMISYSYLNKEFIERICDQFNKDHFRLSIDYDDTFEINMKTKINLMNQSRYILLCLSDEYKQNSYCRCEAYYAYQCQYKIIPLILTPNFHLNDWLIEIIKGKIYIDFIKLDFHLAYQTLKNEINRDGLFTKINSSEINLTLSEPQIQQTDIKYIDCNSENSSSHQMKTEQSIEFQTISFDIQQWTIDHVRTFFINKQFNSFIPIISDMNGCLLYDLYTMCKENRETMFHTLKNEISIIDPSIPPLTISNYLRFLREIDKLIQLSM